MMKQIKLILLTLMLMFISGVVLSKTTTEGGFDGDSIFIPKCEGNYHKRGWTDCYGTITWDDGSSYTGGWKDNAYYGRGIFFQSNGAIEEAGLFETGYLIRKLGRCDKTQKISSWNNCYSTLAFEELTWAWDNNLQIARFHDGFYTGWWVNGLMHGIGMFTNQGEKTQTIVWKAGYPENWGETKLDPCEEGQKVSSWSNCFGNHVFEDGDSYSGEWVDGLMEGVGRYHFSQPTYSEQSYSENTPPKVEIYFGYFERGEIQGGTGRLWRGFGDYPKRDNFERLANVLQINCRFFWGGSEPEYTFTNLKDGSALYLIPCDRGAYTQHFILAYRPSNISQHDFKNFKLVQFEKPSWRGILPTEKTEENDGELPKFEGIIIDPYFTTFGDWWPTMETLKFDKHTKELHNGSCANSHCFNYSRYKWKFNSSDSIFEIIEYKTRFTNSSERGEPNFELDLSIDPPIFKSL